FCAHRRGQRILSCMTLRLDPMHPVVWRDPHTIQVGIEQPIASFTDSTGVYETLLDALRVGVPRGALDTLGAERGLTSRQVERFVRDIEPALTARAPASSSI